MTCPLNSSSLLSALEVAVRATAVGSPAWRVRGNYDALVLCDALARTNTTAAVALFRSILATQGDDGHFPFASYEGSPPAAATGPDWDGCAPPASFWGQTGVPSLVAPPAHATVARRLYQFSANDDDDEEVLSFLRDEAFAALFKWHSHLFGERLSADNATVFIVHPWESPMMDPPELDGPLTRADAGGLPVPALASRCSAAFAPTSQGSDIDRFRQALRLATCVQNRSARQEVPQTIARQCGFQVRSVAVNSMLLRSTADLLAIADLIDSRVPKGGAPHDAEAESLSQWATALAQAIKQADTFDFPRTVAKGDAGLVAALPSDQDLLNGTTAARCPSSSLGISVLLGSSKTTVKTEAQAQLAASVLGPDLWTKYPLRMAAPSLCAGTSSGRCATSMLGQDILTQALDSYVPQDSSAPFASVASYIRGSTVGLLCDRLGPRGAGVDRLPGAIDPISGVALPTLPGPVSNISSSIAAAALINMLRYQLPNKAPPVPPPLSAGVTFAVVAVELGVVFFVMTACIIFGVCHIRRMRKWRQDRFSAEPETAPIHYTDYQAVGDEGDAQAETKASESIQRDPEAGDPPEGQGRQASSEQGKEQSGWGLLSLPFAAAKSAYRAVAGQ